MEEKVKQLFKSCNEAGNIVCESELDWEIMLAKLQDAHLLLESNKVTLEKHKPAFPLHFQTFVNLISKQFPCLLYIYIYIYRSTIQG